MTTWSYKVEASMIMMDVHDVNDITCRNRNATLLRYAGRLFHLIKIEATHIPPCCLMLPAHSETRTLHTLTTNHHS
jgi:hypothetical protein